jgi:hypothetical protein
LRYLSIFEAMKSRILPRKNSEDANNVKIREYEENASTFEPFEYL